MANTITSPIFVVRDNIDTDQIIPAEYLTLVPTKPDEYEKLGSYALIGLPDDQYPEKFVKSGTKTDYKIVIGGKNFGCGSSREHAPIAMGRSHIVVQFAERPVTYLISATLTGLGGIGGVVWSVWTLLITTFRRPW